MIRSKFRAEHLALEHMLINLIGAGKGETVLKGMMTQFGVARNALRDLLENSLPDVISSIPEHGQI